MGEGATLEEAAIEEGAKGPEQFSERSEVLEARLKAEYMENGDVSFDIGKDGELVLFYKGERVYGEGASMPRHFIGTSKNGKRTKANNKDSQQERSNNAAVAIICHTDEKTGQTEYIFEQKPATYPDVKARGLLQFIGGGIEEGEDSLEALVREFSEETPSDSSRILTRALMENGELYDRLSANLDGKTVTTYIYKIRVDSAHEWQRVKDAGLTAEAGPLRVLTSWQALTLPNRYYAYGQGPVIKDSVVSEITRDSLVPKYRMTQNFGLGRSYSFLRTNSMN